MDDFEMAKYPGLTLRNGDGMWQVRKRIPVDLQHIDRRGSIRKTLGTRDKREAIGLYHVAMAEIEAGFERMREELRSRAFVEVALATGRIEDLGRTAIEGLVRKWWQGRREYRQPTWREGQSMAEAMAVLEDDAAMSARAENEGRDLARELADRLLFDAGAASSPRRVGRIKTQVQYPTVDRNTSAYQQLHTLVRQGFKYEMMLARDHLTGDSSTPEHSIFNPQGNTTSTDARTIDDLIRDYRAERERLHGVESTARRFGVLFRLVEEQWGTDLLVPDVTRQRCVDLVNLIQRLPANGTKKFPRMTLAQSLAAADAGEHKRLAPNTVGTYVNNLCALLRWGKNHGYGVTVNTDGLKPTGGAEVERRGMTPSELNVIFPALASYRYSEPHKFWVPALAAYTGARAEELCQLRTEDVIEVDSIACLNLTRFDPTGRAVADSAAPLRSNAKMSVRGVELHGDGYLIEPDTLGKWKQENPDYYDKYVRPYWAAKDLLKRDRGLYIVDLFDQDEAEIREAAPTLYQHLLHTAKPSRATKGVEARRRLWWRLALPHRDLRQSVANLSRYIVTAVTSKHRWFVFADGAKVPDQSLMVFPSDDPALLGLLSSRFHLIWAPIAGGRLGVGDDPRYNNTRCFDPFPFPDDVPEPLMDHIRAVAESLDGLRKRVLAEHEDLTLTKLYNVLDALGKTRALTEVERDIHERGLVTLIRQHHDRIDALAAEAYGWPADLSEEEILTRLVALNSARSAEEAKGKVRWLRPEFQAPDYQAPVTQTLDLGEAPTAVADNVIQWPGTLPEQVSAIQSVLAASPTPLAPQDVARAFKGKRASTVRPVLDALAGIGMARRLADGRYAA